MHNKDVSKYFSIFYIPLNYLVTFSKFFLLFREINRGVCKLVQTLTNIKKIILFLWVKKLKCINMSAR